MNTSSCARSSRDIALLALRISVGVIFVMHGYGKLFGDAPGMTAFTGMISGLGFPLPGFFAYAAALTEFVGGIAILLGLFTSVAAALGAVVMLVAMIMVKKFAFPASDVDLALLGSLIALVCLGAGRYSLAGMLNLKTADGCGTACCDNGDKNECCKK